MNFSPKQSWTSVWLLWLLTSGCGTTRVTDTQRTATEQLLISQAIDDTMAQVDLKPLAGRTVFLDTQYLDGVTDKSYLISALRQHLLANGAFLQEERSKAQYVVEARAGSVGTDRHTLLVGVPQLSVPVFVPGQPNQIPEIPVAKSNDQKAHAKIAVYAYNRITGRPLMQSGNLQAQVWSKDMWIMGMGPFQRGTIRSHTEFAGEPLRLPFFSREESDTAEGNDPRVNITQAATWKDEPFSKEFGPTATPKNGSAGGFASDRDVAPVLQAPPPMLPSKSSPTTAPLPRPSAPVSRSVESEPAHGLFSAFGWKPDP